MGMITGRRYYCIRCHNRPIDDDIWRGGGPGSRLCEVCRTKPKTSYRSPKRRDIYMGSPIEYRGTRERWERHHGQFAPGRFVQFDDVLRIISTNLTDRELGMLLCMPLDEEQKNGL